MSESTSEPLRHTPLYDLHLQWGGRMVPYAGWSMPVQYSGITQEHHAVRQAAGLFDVSHMGQLELAGPRAAEVIDHSVTNDVASLEVGRAAYTCCCNEQGTILDDLIIYRAAEESFLVVCNAANHEKIAAVFAAAAQGQCDFRDLSSETGLLALQGPKAFEILALTGADGAKLSELPSFSFRDAVVCNVRVTVARTGYTGEDGVEIFCKWNDAPVLASMLMELGREHGLVPCGLGARDTLRLEARLSLYGNDIDETTTPLEAGLGWTVKLAKPQFVGKEALLAQKAQPLARKLVGFEMIGRGVARHGYAFKAEPGGAVVGVCTSGSPSPTLGKNIGLGYLPSELSSLGTKFVVDCRGKEIEAVVVKTPFYKRKAIA